MARRYFWIAAFNLALVATVVVARSPVQPEIGWGLALALSAALYGTYVGLAAPATLARLILCCAPMAVVQIAVLGTSGAASGQALTALLAVQIVGATAFRILATRRWRQIDWMSFRPLRSDFL